MYARNTILKRREPFVAPNAEADPPVEGDARHIYNHVRVIGESPVAHMGGPQQWEGVGSRGVIIEPLDGFGGSVDRPLGELQRDYVIEQEPAPTVIQPSIRVINAQTREAGPTPEDVFREAANASSDKRRASRKAA